MRFLTVTHFFEAHGGGIERVAGHLVRELAALGHRSSWAASRADIPPADLAGRAIGLACVNPTEKLTGLPMPIPGPKALATLGRAVADSDVVIIHDGLYVTSIAALLWARRHGKPVILIQHIAEIAFRSGLLRSVMRLANAIVTRPMLRAVDQPLFISATVRDHFRTLRAKREPLLLFNGVDGEIFRPGERGGRPAGIPEKGMLALFAGRLVEKKGLAVIEALARRRPDVQFALAGTGPIDPQAWNLPNVHCLGSLTQTELARLYRTGDVMVLPSVGEGYPLVIQEAMACGLPVICSDESARADPGATGHLRGIKVDLGDPDGTAERVSALLGEEIGRERRMAMADYAARTYQWSSMAKEIAAIGRSLCAARSRSAAPSRAVRVGSARD